MKIRAAIIGLGALAFASTSAMADPDFEKMAGKWKWEDITIEVSVCEETGLCAKVVEGDSKCGGKMIRSKMTKVDANNGTGDICHPKDGKIYKSKITSVDANTTKMVGSSGGTVAEGTFTRVQ